MEDNTNLLSGAASRYLFVSELVFPFLFCKLAVPLEGTGE